MESSVYLGTMEYIREHYVDSEKWSRMWKMAYIGENGTDSEQWRRLRTMV